MPTSSVHPAPTPAPKPGNFSVKGNGTVCLFAYMAAKFDIMIVSTVCVNDNLLPVGFYVTLVFLNIK